MNTGTKIIDWEASPRQLTITVRLEGYGITTMYCKKKSDGKWCHVQKRPALLGGYLIVEGLVVPENVGDGLDMTVAEDPTLGPLLPHYMRRESAEPEPETSRFAEYVVVDVIHPNTGEVDRTLAIPFGESYQIFFESNTLQVRMVEVKKRRREQ